MHGISISLVAGLTGPVFPIFGMISRASAGGNSLLNDVNLLDPYTCADCLVLYDRQVGPLGQIQIRRNGGDLPLERTKDLEMYIKPYLRQFT
jgi:hypothetical protein